MDISSVTTIKKLFYISSVYNNGIYFKSINASNVKEVDGMVSQLEITNINLENIEFSKLTSMENMFQNRFNLPINQVILININSPELITMPNMVHFN